MRRINLCEAPVECRTCNYVETGTTSAALAKITSIMSVETRRNLKLLGGEMYDDGQIMTGQNLHSAVNNHSVLF